MLKNIPFRSLCAVLVVAFPTACFAVKSSQQIVLPAGAGVGEVLLTLPSGTQQTLNAQDRDAPVSIIPVGDQPGKANLNLDLEGDGLYTVQDKATGQPLAVIPISDDQVVEIGDGDNVLDILEASRTSVTITTTNAGGAPRPAEVTVTPVWGDVRDRREYTRDTGAAGSGRIDQIAVNFYRITVTFTGADGKQHTLVRYELIRSDTSRIEINLDDAGNPVNQLLSWDQYFRTTGDRNGLLAVKQQLAQLHAAAAGDAITNDLSAAARELASGFAGRLEAATTRTEKLQVIQRARAKLQKQIRDLEGMGLGPNPEAVREANDYLDRLEGYFNSAQFDPDHLREIKQAEQDIEQRDSATRSAQSSEKAAQTRQAGVQQTGARQGDAGAGDIGLYNTQGARTGTLQTGGAAGSNVATTLRGVTTYFTPLDTSIDLSVNWKPVDNPALGLRYAGSYVDMYGGEAGTATRQPSPDTASGYSDYFESRVGLNFEPQKKLSLSWEEQTADLFAGVFDMKGQGAGQDTDYHTHYATLSVGEQWQPLVTNLGESWTAGNIHSEFLKDMQKSGDGGVLKGAATSDNWEQDTLRIGINQDLDQWGLAGSINYTFTGDKYNDTLTGQVQWNKFTGVWDQRLSARLDFSYACDTDVLNTQQQNALQYKGSFQGVQTSTVANKIGDGICAGSASYVLDAPGPGISVGDFRPGIKTSLYHEQSFQDLSYALDRQVKAAAGIGGRSVADPPPALKRLPNDGFFHSKGSWGQAFDDQWGLKRIGFSASNRDGKGSLWPRTGKPVVVAVVDTGIDFGHPELAGTLWVNARDNPNNDKDDDGNRFKNDLLGWNFVNNGNNTFDDNGHGTFVAGIVAARIDNGMGMAGINPWARIMPVKVANMFGDANDVDVAQGIAYAARNGARVINISIGGRTLSRIEQAAVDEAVKLGALVVVAAGNENEDLKDISPAGLEGVITVTATDHNDKRTRYSNWGAKADIAAPGEEILSLRAIQTDLLQFFDEKYKPGGNIMGTHRHYYRLSGTSFAAPYVTGVASLLLSLHPELTAAQVKRMLLHSARDIEDPGIDQFTGYGLLDAAAALKADPGFFVEARIDSIAVAQADGGQVVQVGGRADADRFKTAWIEIGAGERPDKWLRVAENIAPTSRTAVLANIPAQSFAGSKTWILRLVTEHENGKRRENRFVLKVG